MGCIELGNVTYYHAILKISAHSMKGKDGDLSGAQAQERSRSIVNFYTYFKNISFKWLYLVA